MLERSQPGKERYLRDFEDWEFLLLATEILVKGGTEQDVAGILGISPVIVRKHYAKWAAARRQRISALIQLVQAETPVAQARPKKWPSRSAHFWHTKKTHLQFNERKGVSWWTAWGSNPRPQRCERCALPAELAAPKGPTSSVYHAGFRGPQAPSSWSQSTSRDLRANISTSRSLMA
jgi:hypothetical protein